MKKRVLSLLLALLMVVTLIPTAALAYSATDVKYAVTGGYVYFNKATETITDCDETVTVAEIPATIDGTRVMHVGNYAFKDCTELTSPA